MRHGMRTKSIGRKGAWISQISKYKRPGREKAKIRSEQLQTAVKEELRAAVLGYQSLNIRIFK